MRYYLLISVCLACCVISVALPTSLDSIEDEVIVRPSEAAIQKDVQKYESKSSKFLDDILNRSDDDVPEEVDWRKVDGRVSSVKDQGACVSAWAISGVGVLEGQEKTRRGNESELVELSVQNVLDCANKGHGCNGGFPVNVFRAVGKMGGISDAKSYPYEAKNGKCRHESENVVMTNSDFALLPEGDEEALKKVVAYYGPVSVAINMPKSFMHYEGGIFNDPSCKKTIYNMNHFALLVGYGSDPKEGDYWIVKNSWTEKWGEDGYIRMARNKQNQCGIATWGIIATF